ncbi:MAG TPA: sigma 54-interacting transcriptional regulator [Methylococcus sp.]|nr:sigma 54-interacting transcriptional regulator [Methylococcus sp.]
MKASSPLFNRWLSRVGPDQMIEVLTDWLDRGAVFVVDAEGKLLFWSRGAEKLFGLPADKVLGSPCTKVLQCTEGHDPCGLADQGAIQAETVTLRRRDGTTLACHRTARAFFDGSGQFLGALECLRPEVLATPLLPLRNDAENFHGLVTRDPAMKEAIRIIRNVAETDATVLIRGESGTGKELVARGLHLESHRRERPFLAVNCAALSPNLLESELFGHVKGAFTGAVRDHAGLFQRAHGGTLFLDEVAELPFELQAKLLRVLQDRTFIPVGSDQARTVDVRIIAATHRSLRAEVKAGRFREDLMYRLRVVPIFLPPLRERRQDIHYLLWHFVDGFNRHGPRHIESIAPEAVRRLLDYPWPGNVRELKNVVEYAFAVGRGSELTLADLPPEFRETAAASAEDITFRSTRTQPEDEEARIRQALQRAGGRMEEAARLVGMSRATFWRKRKKYGLR